MSAVFNTFSDEVKSREEEMLELLDSISVDDLKAEGLSLSFGGRTFKFSDVEIMEDETIEEKLRKEFKEKLNTQQQRIREKINAKVNQLMLMHQNKQQEMDRKEAALKRKYSTAAMMPDINESHMLRGLSVVKGSSNDELTWIYRGVYNPRFVVITEGYRRNKTRKAIPSRLVNRMKKDILIIIKTKGNQVTSVATKKAENDGTRTLPSFDHYHQTGGGDCWGSWKYTNSWSTPDDIMKIAKDAEAVLETINDGSIANRGPSGLPRMATLKKNIEDMPENSEATTIEREGGNDQDDDVWQAV
jgi:hypothetical protein